MDSERLWPSCIFGILSCVHVYAFSKKKQKNIVLKKINDDTRGRERNKKEEEEEKIMVWKIGHYS